MGLTDAERHVKVLHMVCMCWQCSSSLARAGTIRDSILRTHPLPLSFGADEQPLRCQIWLFCVLFALDSGFSVQDLIMVQALARDPRRAAVEAALLTALWPRRGFTVAEKPRLMQLLASPDYQGLVQVPSRTAAVTAGRVLSKHRDCMLCSRGLLLKVEYGPVP